MICLSSSVVLCYHIDSVRVEMANRQMLLRPPPITREKFVEIAGTEGYTYSQLFIVMVDRYYEAWKAGIDSTAIEAEHVLTKYQELPLNNEETP